jgi:hypothetical protein
VISPELFPRVGLYRRDVGWRFRAKVAAPTRAVRGADWFPGSY